MATIDSKLLVSDLAIVVVDDTKFGRAVFNSVLSKAGYSDIRVAGSARQALELMEERRADVLVADWFMPEMDGLELTHRVRQLDEERNGYTSIILCTALEGVNALVTAFRRGVDDFIRKPFDHEELIARVYAAGNSANLHNMLLESAQRMQQSNQELSELSARDPLTGLGNASFLAQQLDALLAEVAARGGGVCCALVAIDEWNALLEKHAGDEADQIRIGVARRIRRTIRPTDVAAISQDGEFAVVLHYPDVAAFRATVFERLQAEICERPLAVLGTDLPISVSIGASLFEDQPDNPTAETLLEDARRQLRDACSHGNRQIKY
ncbi:MAG: response regulator [Gammaproteobacteria bacterium]|nr:response regulator [Gammaproteobacteria bacterium]